MALDNTYGFLPNLPEGIQAEHRVQLALADAPPWCTTSMVPEARNHCAAVMAANLVLTLCCPYRPHCSVANEAYHVIGPGPIVRGLRYAKAFLRQEGYIARVKRIVSPGALCAALAAGRPAALLVTGPSICMDWHWIVACGFTRLEDGRIFWHIADGWHETTRYFVQGQGSRWILGGTFGPGAER